VQDHQAERPGYGHLRESEAQAEAGLSTLYGKRRDFAPGALLYEKAGVW
jgi:hypothetical protein